MKTFLPKVDEIENKWWVVDATDQVLGRLAVKIADTLRGKNKPTYTPHLDCGDHVIVINAEKIVLTGRKSEEKQYQHYTGHMSGRKVFDASFVRERHPERLIRQAVQGMMPKGRLSRQQFSKLKVYAGPEHPHEAQQAQPFPY